MKIAIGADHGGFQLKQRLIEHLRGQGHEVKDLGAHSTQAVDYPVFARRVAEAVAAGEVQRGIMIDGAGIGSSMTANKVRGVRAAMSYDLSSARNAREHNDANVLTLGAGLIGPNLAVQIVDVFLSAQCAEPRHLQRVAMIEPRAAAPPPQAGAPDEGLPVLGITDTDLARIARRIESLLASGPVRTSGSAHTAPASQDVPVDLARFIDHTILKPDATADMVDKVVAEARAFGFRSVCVNPCWVPRVAEGLRGTRVLTCSVVGFPLGANMPEVKGLETRRAIRDGAREIDMVINIGRLKSGDEPYVLKDILAVVEACRDGSAVSKIIIETALLSDDEKVRACELARRARANFVKTSTGFAPGGATAADVALMASVVRPAGIEVKASGGIKTLDDARRMIAEGATRLGMSASVAVVEEAQRSHSIQGAG
jgi:deoxyribose-phosphate aldolase